MKTKMPKLKSPAEQKAEEVISTGGSVKAEKAEANSGKKSHLIQLDVPMDIVNDMNAAVAKNRIKPSRHKWILEAIVEKIEREL